MIISCESDQQLNMRQFVINIHKLVFHWRCVLRELSSEENNKIIKYRVLTTNWTNNNNFFLNKKITLYYSALTDCVLCTLSAEFVVILEHNIQVRIFFYTVHVILLWPTIPLCQQRIYDFAQEKFPIAAAKKQ